MALENTVFTEIRSALITGFSDLSLSDVEVVRSFQPTMQGRDSTRTVYLSHIEPDQLYGSPFRNDEWDEPNQKMVHTYIQEIISTFQVNALAIQDPTSPTQVTASDLLLYAASVLQSRKAIDYLQSKEIGVLKVMQSRNPYFVNDDGQKEAMPSFDFQVSHKQVIISETPVIESFEYNFDRI